MNQFAGSQRYTASDGTVWECQVWRNESGRWWAESRDPLMGRVIRSGQQHSRNEAILKLTENIEDQAVLA